MPEKQNKTTTKTSVIGMVNKRFSFCAICVTVNPPYSVNN